MNRHIDTDTKRVGAADHWQQSLLGELLHQTTIAGDNRIAPRAAQIRMEQHIVTQMVAGDCLSVIRSSFGKNPFSANAA